MTPRVHVETMPRTSEDTGRRPLPPAVAWTVAGLMVVLTLSGSAIGAAATFGVGIGPLPIVLAALLVVAAAVALAPRVGRARH